MIPPQPRSTLFPYTTLFRSFKDWNFLRLNKLAISNIANLKIHLLPNLRKVDILIHFEVDSQSTIKTKFYYQDRKSTRLNSSHANISYAVFCLKKKKKNIMST